MSLHDKILNIPCEVDKAKKTINRIEYQKGHRDARHSAAELVIEYDEEMERLKRQLSYAHDTIEKLKNIERIANEK